MSRITPRLAVFWLAAALVLLAVGITAAAGANSKAAAPHFKSPHLALQATLVVKSDEQHGKKGPDGKWHDSFLPGDFTILAGTPVKVTIFNYDDAPHSFTAPTLHLNKLVPGVKGNTLGKVTFTFIANKSGKYAWWCATPCDPWAMSHDGYMRGYVKVVA